MQSRVARLILLCLFLIAISTAAFLFWKGDTAAAAGALDARSFDSSARIAERAVLDLRAAQLGYAIAGQPAERSIARVAQPLGAARTNIQAMRAMTKVAEVTSALDAASAALNEFTRSDKRAAEYARNDQRLLASDVVLGDGLERTETALAAIERARAAEAQAREAGISIYRSRQVFALAAGAAAAVLVVLLLVPVAKPAETSAVVAAHAGQSAAPYRVDSTSAASSDPPLAEGIVSLARRDSMGEAAVELAAGTGSEGFETFETAAGEVSVEEVLVGSALPPAMPVMTAQSTNFAGVAALCVDLARVVDTRALPSLLDRTAEILDASGIILWIADPDGRELNPIFAQGYPQQLVNRLGTIPRDAENATAAAFRTSLLQTVLADSISGGAIAAPLVTAGGCVGVMAAEVRHDSERQDEKLAAATIVAAQLATLVGPPSARPQARSAGA
jgi:GAF domain